MCIRDRHLRENGGVIAGGKIPHKEIVLSNMYAVGVVVQICAGHGDFFKFIPGPFAVVVHFVHIVVRISVLRQNRFIEESNLTEGNFIKTVYVRNGKIQRAVESSDFLTGEIKPVGVAEISVCLLYTSYPSEMAQPYRPWHDVFRKMDDIATEL